MLYFNGTLPFATISRLTPAFYLKLANRTLGDKLYLYQTYLEFQQKEFAFELNISLKSLNELINDVREPSFPILRKLALYQLRTNEGILKKRLDLNWFIRTPSVVKDTRSPGRPDRAKIKSKRSRK